MIVLDEGERTARKAHRCYDCGCEIARGERYAFNVTVDCGSATTFRSHLDCRAAALCYVADWPWSDLEDGIQPLACMIADSGQAEAECNALRGYFPHVVTRIERRQQLAEIRWRDQLRALGFDPDEHD